MNTLLIHSSPEERERIESALHEIGCQVVSSPCVISGLSQCDRALPTLILVEQNGASLSAMELLELRHTEPALVDIPVVVVTRNAACALEALQRGADEVIVPPVHKQEFLLRVGRLLQRAGEGGVRGELTHIGFIELLQLIVAAGKEGRLDLTSHEARGVIFFQRGQAVHAESGSLRGEEALQLLLRHFHERGRFVFHAAPITGVTATIEKRTDHLLLEFASAIDEN